MNDTAERFARAIECLGSTPAERQARLPGVSERTLRYWLALRFQPRHLAELERAGVITINAPAKAEARND